MELSEKLVFKNLEKRFSKCLEDQTNSQILFSGPFGSGKTTFLKSYFESQKDINIFRLFPVNYALHENSDICEIIKYDIILELIQKNGFKEVDIDGLTRYVVSTLQSVDQAIGKLLKNFTSTGKSVAEAGEILESAIKDHQSHYKSLSDPLIAVRSFNQTVGKIRSYSHEDYITSVIKEKLTELKKSEGKLNVMIVDDMDRIDPEHLFRIISIFSAHIDNDKEENKFGFDKIIFVGDNENFRSIFCHRYGMSNNYDAYISKLSSKTPFTFDPDRELYHEIGKMLDGIKFHSDQSGEPITISEAQTARAKRHFLYIIGALLKSGGLTLREMVKFQGTNSTQPINVNALYSLNTHIENYYLYPLLVLMKLIFPTRNQLTNAFQVAIKNPLPSDRVIKTSGGQRNKLNVELSIIPLQLLTARQALEKRGTTQATHFGSKQFEINYHMLPSGHVEPKLIELYASERAVLELTLESLIEMDELISD